MEEGPEKGKAGRSEGCPERTAQAAGCRGRGGIPGAPGGGGAEGRPAEARGRAAGPPRAVNRPPAAPGPMGLSRVSRIFHRGKPPRGVRTRPRPWKRRAGRDGAWGSQRLTILLGGRRLARAEECRRSDWLPQEAAAAAAQLRSAGAAAALGTPAGEGVRAGGGEAAPRRPRRPGDWAHAGSSKEKRN